MLLLTPEGFRVGLVVALMNLDLCALLQSHPHHQSNAAVFEQRLRGGAGLRRGEERLPEGERHRDLPGPRLQSEAGQWTETRAGGAVISCVLYV